MSFGDDSLEEQRKASHIDQISRSSADKDEEYSADGLPVQMVPATPDNISRHGSPIERSAQAHIRYYFYPTWRSQFWPLIFFFITAWLAVWVSGKVPQTVITGPLFAIGNTTYFLSLPLLVLIPGAVLGKILIYIYDSKYIIDERGVESQEGLVSFNLRQPRLRYEDIRGVEPQQTIWERILGIGSVLVGSAMTKDVEIVMEGVANPRAIQLLIGGERDLRMRMLQQGGGSALSSALQGD